MAGNGATAGSSGHKTLPLECRLSRWILAAAVLVGWAALYGYWLLSGTQPSCQVVTVARGTSRALATTTRTCGMPDAITYLYLGAIVVLLLLPDARVIALAGARFERADQGSYEPGPTQMAFQATAGDTPDAKTPAASVILQFLTPGE